MKQFFNISNKSSLTLRTSLLSKTILLLAAFTLSGNAWGQRYSGTTWYSLYDETQYNVEWALVSDKTVHTYNSGIFTPINGNCIIDAKLEGDAQSSSSLTDLFSGGVSTKSNFSDPQKWGVTNPYTLEIGGKSKEISLTVTGTKNSYKPLFKTYYYYAYSYDFTTNQEVTGLDAKTTSIDVVAPSNYTNNNHQVYIKNMRVPMASHIRLKSTNSNDAKTHGVTEKTMPAFDDTEWGTTCAGTKTVEFRSFLTESNNGTITITSSNPNVFRVGSADNTGTKTYNVGKNMFAYENGSGNCSTGNAGKASNYNFKIYFVPQAAENYTGTITISNGTGTNSVVTVHVSGKGLKKNQSINWTQDTEVAADASLTLNATATSGLDVTYSVVSGSEYATVNATTGVVTILKGDGDVKFKASQSGNELYYNAAPDKELTFHISKVTPTITSEPTTPDVYLRTTLVSCELNGGSASSDNVASVAGDFVWQTPSTAVERNNTGYTVEFQPKKTDWYNKATCNVVVGINKYNPEITTNTLSAALTYGQKLKDADLSGEFVLTDTVPLPHVAINVSRQWKEKESTPAVGTPNATMEFVYNNEDAKWFLPVEVSVPIEVAKADPKTIAATATLAYGQQLSEAMDELINTTIGVFDEPVDGSFAWLPEEDLTAILEARNEPYEFDVTFTSNNNNYNGGNGKIYVTVTPGIVFNGTENDVWTNSNNWTGGVPSTTDRVVINDDIEISGDITVGGITINAGKTVTVTDGASLTIGDKNSLTRGEYGNIIVEAGGQLNLSNEDNKGNVQVNDFTLFSNFENEQPKSGQVSNPTKLTTHGDAYFILDLDPSGSASYGWYSFTVPFHVDALNGVYRLDNGNWVKAVNEVNYAIMDYHEDLRAQGKYGWKKYRSTLQPGVGYLMTVENQLNRYRFTKTKSGNFNTEMTQTLTVTDGADKDKGWNSLGNGTTSYVTYASTPRYAQLYNHSTNAYDIELTTGNALVVGAAYFVQAETNNSTITMQAASDATTGLLRAPQRDTESDICFVNLSLRNNGKSNDKLFITCDDNAAATYTIGKDVVKMGATSGISVARLWANAKNATLGAVDVAYSDDKAIIPLGIYTPAAGEYTIAIDNSPTEDVYLTHNGIIVWNLSMSDYTFDFNAGTDTSYALQVVRRINNTATGVDAIDNDKRGTDFVEKIIVNGQLYILRDGMIYDAQGKKVSNF